MGTIADKFKSLVAQILGVSVAEERSADSLSLIEDAAQRSALYELGSFALSEDENIRGAAITAVKNLLSPASPMQLARLDLLMREISPYLGANRERWFQLLPTDIVRFESAEDSSLLLLGLASFHHSGYVREAAIKRLMANHDGRELPYLLIRLNDWVEPVKRLAEKAIHDRLRADYAHHWVANLALLQRLFQAKRQNHESLGEEVFALLRQTDCQYALSQGLADGDFRNRKLCFQIAAESTPSLLCELIEQSLRDTHPVIRLWGARQAAKLDAADVAPLFGLMRWDWFMPVRREALRLLTDKLPHLAADELKFALLDSSASLRWDAAQMLKKLQPIDLQAFYRGTLGKVADADLLGALGGLGENGNKEDADLVLRYVEHHKSKVRKAALRALCHLSAEDHLDIFYAKLTDPSTNVSREAGKTLAGKSRLLQGARLWEIFNEAPRQDVKLRVLSLLFHLPKWDSIPFLLKASADSDQGIAQTANHLMRQWFARFNRQATQASAVQSEMARRVFAECKKKLPEWMQKNLAFYLKEN